MISKHKGNARAPDASDRRTGSPRRQGFTLIEALASMMVIGIVLTSAFAAMGQGFRLVESARDYTRVAQILQSEMEDLKTLSWDDLEAVTTGNYVEVSLGVDFVTLFGDRYTVSRQVSNRVDGGVTLADQKEIRVKARWQNSNGTWVEKETLSWYTKNGMHDYYYRSF